MSKPSSKPWVDAKLFTHDDVCEPPAEWVGEDGGIEIERSDEDEVGVHFRHALDENAVLTAYITRAQALALAHALTAKALA